MSEQYKTEVFETERAFAQLAKEQGVKVAFITYAAEDAVLSRGNELIKGRDAIAAYFDKQTMQDVQLAWEPDFVDVAASGDLAYTYGPFKFSGTNPAGERVEAEGVFHTVWKRQVTGEWRYVWD